MKLTFVYLLTLIYLSNQIYGELIVKINEGFIKGQYGITRNGKIFASYTGIPYAEPPVCNLRFMPPEPKKPWDGIKDASKPHNMCIQRNIFVRSELIEGDEDCLYLNVYTPKLNASIEQELPVMLFIHGGGYLAGSALDYKGDILMDRDVVLVAINYRLGPLGFITTGDEVVPGNNGMKDQTFAIKWTRDNIKAFGGDPNKITVFGESVGGASAHMHMLSPLSRDLIYAAISQSGTAVSPWAINPKGEGVSFTKKLARTLNCPTECSKAMVECLRKVEASKIIEQDKKFMFWDTDPMMPFKPCIEPKHEGAFLSEHPLTIIKSGKAPKVPWMLGLNGQDGAVRAAAVIDNAYLLGDLNDEFNRLAPMALLFDKVTKNPEKFAKKLRKFYFGDEPIDRKSKSKIIDMYTDGLFAAGKDESVRLHMKYSKIPNYYYLFDYRGTTSLSAIFGDPNEDYGVCHVDELQYLFPLAEQYFPKKMLTENDEAMKDLMTHLWVNFATTGNPTPVLNEIITEKWTPVTSEDTEYFHIVGPQKMKMSKGLFSDRMKFWRSLIDNEVNHKIRDEL